MFKVAPMEKIKPHKFTPLSLLYHNVVGDAEGGDPSSLLSKVLCPVLCSPVQKRGGHTGESPTNGQERWLSASLQWGKAERTGTVRRRKGSMGILSMCISTWRQRLSKRKPDSSQWCPVTSQDETVTNWNTGNPKWTGENTSLLVVKLSSKVVKSSSVETFSIQLGMFLGNLL